MENSNNYVKRFVDLMHTEFCDWEAKRLGIIDGNGNLLRRPNNSEKQHYDRFHEIVRSCKLSSGIDNVYVAESIKKLAPSHITEQEVNTLLEEMVAGDSGYDSTNIASGTTSGDVVNAGPKTLTKKRRAKKRK